MPYETGNATSISSQTHVDLLNKLRTFLTATLPVGSRWVEQRYISTYGSEELILRGVGTSGSDYIYIGLKTYAIESGQGNYGLILNGFTGYNPLLSFYEQPGAMQISDTLISLPLKNSDTIKYWFIANSRRVIIIAQVGSRWHQAYLGFGIPYGLPSQWPYPLIIGGSGSVRNSGSNVGIPVEGTTSSSAIHAFWKPINVSDGLNGLTLNVGNLAVKSPDGSYRRPYLSVSGNASSLGSGTWPYVESIRDTVYGGIINMRPVLGTNNYTLNPIMIVEGTPANTWGEFDGIRHVTGFNLDSTHTVVVGSDTWLCINNVYREDNDAMAAFKLT